MASKRTRQTFAKREREQLVREKRAKKLLKKQQAISARDAVSPAHNEEAGPAQP